jgi:hypothetical protein
MRAHPATDVLERHELQRRFRRTSDAAQTQAGWNRRAPRLDSAVEQAD